MWTPSGGGGIIILPPTLAHDRNSYDRNHFEPILFSAISLALGWEQDTPAMAFVTTL